ncbi:hypothetical protein CC78DRAFT_610903 [Lojkania enalia]|uniref:Uncharacterized protein n=1 Tax=Lojkania enalia TaxID=147567 RepID=A0A9P4TRD3_9PLEO|nr:hypothetical protein CC78DRAFT_610903 [Didymosphaeria enalia]
MTGSHGHSISASNLSSVLFPPTPSMISLSRSKFADYIPLSPYADNEGTLPNNIICPRYADCDASSAPPSPASIESFDILDSVAWRRGHISHRDIEGKVSTYDALASSWNNKKSRMIGILLLFILLGAGCSAGAYLVVRHKKGGIQDECARRQGRDRCTETTWAKCVARNGVGYCEGVP